MDAKTCIDRTQSFIDAARAYHAAARIPQGHISRLESGSDGVPQIGRVKGVLEAIGYKLMLTARKTATEYEFTF